jgi:hypothetical protein
MSHLKQELDDHLERFERRLPERMRGFVRWLRRPGSGWTRIPLGVVLILGGIVGFLPILGFWMIPLGLLVLAIDLPIVRPPLIWLLDWVEAKWPAPEPEPRSPSHPQPKPPAA